MREAPNPSGVHWAADRSFRQLYETHFDEVMSFILRFGIGTQDAEDLVQRVFMVALRQRPEAAELQLPGAWLRAVALRVVHDHFRWWRVRRTAQAIVELSWAAKQCDETTPEHEVQSKEAIECIRGVLYRMSGKLRDALVVLDIEGLSERDAAELLGVPFNTMRSRHKLAREQFKRMWEQTHQQREKVND